MLKEPLHHLVPVTVVVLQGHFGDLKHRAELMRGVGVTEGQTPWLLDLESILPDSQEGILAGNTASNRKLSHQKLLIKRLGLFFRSCHSVNKY